MADRAARALDIAGRDREQSMIERFVSAAWPAALRLEGSAGIGKTTLWALSIDRLAELGVGIWTARMAEAERDVAYASLDVLLGPHLRHLAGLAPHRQDALEAILGGKRLEHDLDVRSAGLAVADLVTTAAEDSPLVMAIDDAQWIDTASAAVLAFAFRRLGGRPVGLLSTRRSGVEAPDAMLEAALAPHATAVIELGPLSVGAVARILRERLDLRLSRAQLVRLHELSTGNPLTALELGRAMLGGRGLGESVIQAELVQRRVAQLGAGVRTLLALIGLSGEPTLELVEQVLGDGQSVRELLAEAVANEVVTVEAGSIRSAHPLLAAASVELLPPSGRRALHAAIAGVVVAPELVALHQALATSGPDEHVASALERAAELRAQQGATGRASELMAMAIERSPADDVVTSRRRRLLHARLLLKAGDVRAAAGELDALAVDSTVPGELVDLHLLSADVAAATDDRAAAREAAMVALLHAGGDARLAARCHAAIAQSTPLGVADELEHSRLVLTLVSPTEDPTAVAQALTTIIQAEIAAGDGIDDALFEQAMALESLSSMRAIDRPSSALVTAPRTAGDLVTARRMQIDAIEQARRAGDESAIPFQLAQLAAIDLRDGDVGAARTHLDEAEELSVVQELELPAIVPYRALALALAGRLDDAEEMARSERERREGEGNRWALILLDRPLALVALQRGDAVTAARLLAGGREAAQSFGVHEPAYFAVDADLVEALVAVRDRAGAEAVVEDLEQFAERGRLPWTRLAAARCRLLVQAGFDEADGDIDSAIARCEDALSGVTSGYEHGRTRLVIGRVLQRRGRRREARTHLERARDQFLSLGVLGFAALTEREIDRLGGRPKAGLELTTSERQVAELAAEGLSNREIGERLFLGVRTVESHLSAVYRKLGVPSRKALIRQMSVGSG